VDTSAVASDGSVISRWHDYALGSITPQFSWAILPQDFEVPQVLDNYSGEVARKPLFRAQTSAATRLSISIASGNVADTPSVLPDQSSHLAGLPQPGLQRTVVAPTLSSAWGARGSVRVTGILAYQRFASLGLGTATGDGWAPVPTWREDSSYGAGARLDVENAISDRLRLNLGYQSRVGMGTFANYRGVFADQGDFDIPANASAGLSYALTPQFGVDIGVQLHAHQVVVPADAPHQRIQHHHGHDRDPRALDKLGNEHDR
jgi:long-chain fatty acid transport protein